MQNNEHLISFADVLPTVCDEREVLDDTSLNYKDSQDEPFVQNQLEFKAESKFSRKKSKLAARSIPKENDYKKIAQIRDADAQCDSEGLVASTLKDLNDLHSLRSCKLNSM